MTRSEKIKQVAEELAKNAYCDKHNLIWFFKKGTEWADEHPQKNLWNKEKVCKYLKMILETTDANYNETYIRTFQFNNVDKLIEDLTKTIEEQQ